MNQPRRLKTKKLFFKEYAYKVSTFIRGGGYLRYHTPSDLIHKCLHTDDFTTWGMNWVHPEELAEFSKIYKSFVKEDIKFRYDSHGVDFYTKDAALHNRLVKKFKNFVEEIIEPESPEELQYLLDHSKFVIVDQLPYEKYTHKVIFKQIPSNLRESLFVWASKYPEDAIKMSETTKKYLSGSRGYMTDPFFYVADEKMLMMIGLIASNHISRTDKFILRSSINTSS